MRRTKGRYQRLDGMHRWQPRLARPVVDTHQLASPRLQVSVTLHV
jgi:hypothetical protein